MHQVKIKRFPHSVPHDVPSYATDGRLGLDLRAAIDKPRTIHPYTTVYVPTGIAVDFSDTQLGMLLLSRSGISSKSGIILANSVGLVDWDYKAEIILALYNRSTKCYSLLPHSRIAQAIFVPMYRIEFIFEDFKAGQHSGFCSTGIA